MWVFPPRKIQSRLLIRIQSARKRPAILYLLMHHAELPAEYQILKGMSVKHIRYTGNGMYLRPQRNKQSFKSYNGPEASIFLLPPLW